MKNIISLKEYLKGSNDKEIQNIINVIFDLLSQLTSSPKLSKDEFITIINNLPNNHNIYIYKNIDNLPVGIITLIIEQKIIHGGKCVGHIEDLVVDNKYKGRGIAQELIKNCIDIAKNNNCYKIILDCKEELIPFYNKTDFKQQGVCMRREV